MSRWILGSGGLSYLNRRGRKGLGSAFLRVAAVSGLMAGVALLGVPAAVASGGSSPYTLLSVPVGGAPAGVAVDEDTDTIYAANNCASSETCSTGTVSVINGATNAVTTTINVGEGADAVAVDENTDTIYTANGCFFAQSCTPANTVSVINGATNTVTDTINVGTHPWGVAVDDDTDTIYVSTQGSVSVIDGATNTVTTTITTCEPVADCAGAEVAVDEATDTIYDANEYSGVSVINGATNTVTDTITGLTSFPFGVAVDAATDNLYVTEPEAGIVSVVNTTTNKVTSSFTPQSYPRGVAVDQTTNTVYVANECGNQTPDCPTNPYIGTVSVINGATNTVTYNLTLTTLAEDPFAVAVDQTTDTIYTAVTDSDGVQIIIPSSVSVSPTSGHPGTSVTVSGRGFKPGETVKITYQTGLASPKSVTICSATAASDTTYSCSGTIPSKATAGAHRAHKITATGLTSLIKVKTTFTLT